MRSSGNPSHQHSNSQKIPTSTVSSDSRTCYYCRFEGHIAKFCPRLKDTIMKRRQSKFFQKAPVANLSVQVKQTKTVKEVKAKQQTKYVPVQPTVNTQKGPLRYQTDASSNEDFKQNATLVDVVVTDASGRPRSIKAWVPIKN
jgi:hypothetical protein